jgi:chromosome partitioning protein
MDGINDQYDYIFIDVPPSLGLLTLNSIVASDSVIIPIQAEFYALEGMADLIKAMDLVETRLNSPSPIKGILLTLYDSRTRLGRDVYNNVKEYFGETEYIFKTTIPRNVRLAEAPSHGKPCIVYDEECSGTVAYQKLAEELLKLESLGG